MWGGAFGETTDALVDRFGQSIASDLRFWQEDLIGSVAHARMLGKVGVLSAEESKKLIEGLEEIHEAGPDSLPLDVEDIHTAIEVRLGEIVGEVAKKLHTARSRNDQVATDTRLYLHNELVHLLRELKSLQAVLLEVARKHRHTLMPGYTHMQPAQPITLGFLMLAHFWAMQRHGWRAERLFDAANYCPLGAAALAGTGFPIDRRMTSSELGFTAPIPNALDAVSDRSYVLDALHNCALLMIHLSRMCQELILWSTQEFGFVRLSDRVTTGSSIMPQKRNPDMAELIRGRAGRAIGNWTALAATLKALPLGYNRDTQDDKPPLFESLDLARDSLRLVSLMISEAEWDARKMAGAARQGFTVATDIADLLAEQGIPFREAHEIVGRMVRDCREKGRFTRESLNQHLAGLLTQEALAAAEKLLDARGSVRRRESEGGTGPQAMARQLLHAAKLHRAVGFARLT